MGNSNCRLIKLPKISEPRGSLTFIEELRHIPFFVKRVYYMYDVPSGETRAGHAHKILTQLVIPVSGSFDITLDDGKERTKYHMHLPDYGLLIPPMVWREIDNFSSGAVCLVLASENYDESDYYRKYSDFIASIKEKND